MTVDPETLLKLVQDAMRRLEKMKSVGKKRCPACNRDFFYTEQCALDSLGSHKPWRCRTCCMALQSHSVRSCILDSAYCHQCGAGDPIGDDPKKVKVVIRPKWRE